VDVLINNGTGTFTPTNYATSTAPTRLATADFDGNGFVDVAVSHSSGVVIVMMNNGAGAFPTRNSFTVVAGSSLNGIVAVDVDGVNRADILVANRTNNAVALLRNNGAGNFTMITPNFITGVTTPFQMDSADFNNDARPDVVFTSFSTVNAWSCLNNAGTSYVCSANTSTGALSDVAAGDLNNDGKPDFVLTTVGNNNVFGYMGNGAGTFNQVASNGIAGTWNSIKLADIDKDNLLDVVFAGSANQVGVCRGNGLGGFGAATGVRATVAAPRRVVVGQFNTGVDQKDDFAASSTAGVHVSLSNAQ